MYTYRLAWCACRGLLPGGPSIARHDGGNMRNNNSTNANNDNAATTTTATTNNRDYCY